MPSPGVRQVIGRMISDPAFATAVHKDAKAAVSAAGYHLSTDELSAVAKLKASDLSVVQRPGVGSKVGVWEISSVKG